jgi:hypothetical protein
MVAATSMPGVSQPRVSLSAAQFGVDTIAAERAPVHDAADSLWHRAIGLVGHWGDPIGLTIGAGVHRYRSWSRGCCILGGSMEYLAADAGPHGGRIALGAAGWEKLGTIGADLQLLYVANGAARTATPGRAHMGASLWYGVGYAPFIMLNIGVAGYIRLGGGPRDQEALLVRPLVGGAVFGPRLFP